MSSTKQCGGGGQTQTVPRYGVFEVAMTSKESLENPFWDVRVCGEFVSPSGGRIFVEGFYHGGDTWCVRFAPREIGEWSFIATLAGGSEEIRQEGSFTCSGQLAHGSLRVSEGNCYRLEYEDGVAFYPIGIQTCGYFQVGFDGPPEGGKHRNVPAEQWCQEFEGAFNLIRWQLGAGTTAGCALELIPKGAPADRYDTELAGKMDELLRLQKRHGFSHIMILFQDMGRWNDSETTFGSTQDTTTYKSVTAENLPLQEKFIRYVIARWGCFVDIWELFNEDGYAPDDYLSHLADVVRQADPYGRLLTTNYSRPGSRGEWQDILTWHEYVTVPAEEVDVHILEQLVLWKSYGKVVLNTEFGNKPLLSNFDPVKWRIAAWAAFMNEGSLLFWGMSGFRVAAGPNIRCNANAYIGPQTRAAMRVLNDFTDGMPVEMKPVETGYTGDVGVRAYALSSGPVSAVYVHHFADHERTIRQPMSFGVQIGPGDFHAEWIDPASGQQVHSEQLTTESDFLRLPIPPFKIDLACKLTRAG